MALACMLRWCTLPSLLRGPLERLQHPSQREAEGASERPPVRDFHIHSARGLRPDECGQRRDQEEIWPGLIQSRDPPVELTGLPADAPAAQLRQRDVP